MTRKPKFFLSGEEQSLWLAAVTHTKKLKEKIPKTKARAEEHLIKPLPKILSSNIQLISYPININTSTTKKIAKGKIAIDATLDLHGYTEREAFILFKEFIERCFINHKRLLLVITGKGKTSNSNGILKNALPLWVSEGGFQSKILNFKLAHPRHGGAGAYYVFLKKYKNDTINKTA